MYMRVQEKEMEKGPKKVKVSKGPTFSFLSLLLLSLKSEPLSRQIWRKTDITIPLLTLFRLQSQKIHNAQTELDPDSCMEGL